MKTEATLRRYLIYKTAEARQFFCVCAARSATHALAIARQSFTLPRTARAILETPPL